MIFLDLPFDLKLHNICNVILAQTLFASSVFRHGPSIRGPSPGCPQARQAQMNHPTKKRLTGSMPLQFFEFIGLLLQFIILEPYHCKFTTLRNMLLCTPSICFLKFMDQNTPVFFLLSSPLFSSSSWLSWNSCCAANHSLFCCIHGWGSHGASGSSPIL